VWQCVAVCCSVLQCVAECCSVLQCVAVCCSLPDWADGGLVRGLRVYVALTIAVRELEAEPL